MASVVRCRSFVTVARSRIPWSAAGETAVPAGAVLTNKRGQLQLRHRDVDSLIRDLRCVHVHQQIHRGLASSSWFGDVLSTVTKAAGIGDTKELVGVDRGGNQYFEDKGAKGNYNSQFKRIVEPPKGMLPEDFDNESIPSEWRQWLSYTRLNPPTADEMVHAEQSQEQMAINVARLEAEEAKQQFVQVDSAFAQAVNTAAGFGGSAPTGEKETFAPGEWMPGASGDGGASPTVKTPQEQRGARKPNATPTPGQDFEPSSWSPGGQTKESGRGGGGGDFTPGEWKPGG